MKVDIKVASRFSSFLFDWDYETYLPIGGYGSGKSYNVVLKIVMKCLSEKRKVLVVRNVFATLEESCYSLFEEILQNMDMLSDGTKNDGKVKMSKHPMNIRFPNGSKIIFKGMDNIEKVKSINGISIVWIEECSEIKYDAYMELQGRVRQPNVSLHFILSCNPVGKENWVYNTFFVRLDDDGNEHVILDENKLYERKTIVVDGVYYHHSTLDDNPFLPQSYIDRIEKTEKTDKRFWMVARNGRFGAAGTIVLPNFEIAKDAKAFKKKVQSISSEHHYFGLDFGFETSFNALMSCCVDDYEKVLYIYDEVYVNRITDDRFVNRLDVQRVSSRANLCDKPICADCAEPKTIQYYRQQGFTIKAAKKYIGSRLQNTKKMKRFNKIVCSPKCKNTIRELKDLTYKKDSRGNVIYDEFNIDPHTFSALWYALDDYTVADLKDIKTNSKAG